MNVSATIEEINIHQGDPRVNTFIRLVETLKIGEPGRLLIWTERPDLGPDFWRELGLYAEALARLQREFWTTGFFSRVAEVALELDPVGLSLAAVDRASASWLGNLRRRLDSKRKNEGLIRTLVASTPLAFHQSATTALAAAGLPQATDFLCGNFQMRVGPTNMTRYVGLKVLQRLCAKEFQGPEILTRMDPAIDRCYVGVKGSSVESDLVAQAEDLVELLRAGHVVLRVLRALGNERVT